jgi:hypothetical protein
LEKSAIIAVVQLNLQTSVQMLVLEVVMTRRIVMASLRMTAVSLPVARKKILLILKMILAKYSDPIIGIDRKVMS